VVVRFSANYLDGDPRQGAFMGRLALTLSMVMLLVTSGNLFQLVVAWLGTSLALHGLLLFYAERRGAIVAAKKKFITARIGDACVVVAALLLVAAFGTADIAGIMEAAKESAKDATNAADTGAIPTIAIAAAFLIAFAALLKSAQFPTHGWLTEVMETPTPVSALLHAGIINAGGFIVIRFADVMVLSATSLHLLAIVGGFTALFGAVVMLTQSSVKVSLAWSTVAQMGFMLLQCGLGAFALALLHIVAHSLYKAHAFLSSGSVIEIKKASWVPDGDARPAVEKVLASFLVALALYGVIGSLFGLYANAPSAVIVLGAILTMGTTLLVAQGMAGRTNAYVIGRTVLAAAAVTLVYFVVQGLALSGMASTVPTPNGASAADIAIMMLAVLSFAVVTVLQIVAPVWADAPAWRAARVHLANGLYANQAFDQLVGALKIIPQKSLKAE
ncbi:MAG: proton-conducting transporter membrane subunit, partial [Pseudomonadota bacterium]